MEELIVQIMAVINSVYWLRGIIVFLFIMNILSLMGRTKTIKLAKKILGQYKKQIDSEYIQLLFIGFLIKENKKKRDHVNSLYTQLAYRNNVLAKNNIDIKTRKKGKRYCYVK